MRLKSIIFLTTILYSTKPVFLQGKFDIADSINRFSVDLLAAVNKQAGDSLNIALSPLAIWTLLTVVSEGANDDTADQLNNALHEPQNKAEVRDSYQKLSRMLQAKSNEAELETSNGIFTSQKFPVKDKFASTAKQSYGTSIFPVNFEQNHVEAANVINKYVAKATNNRIPMLVSPADVQNAFMFMTSTMYFKGQWEAPFNKSATHRDAFNDDKKKKIGEVDMMYKAYPFGYTRNDRMKADIIELSYGFDDKYSMLVMIPRGAQTLGNMLDALSKESMQEILAILKRNKQMFAEDDIHVYLPKFKITSDFNLDGVLSAMGITDLFDPYKANLLGIFPHYLFLSRVIQKAEIEVDEEGTVASAAAGAVFINRAPPPVFKANRPFLYFIVQKESGTIIFAGKLSNPNTLGQ